MNILTIPPLTTPLLEPESLTRLTVTGTILEEELRGKTRAERAHFAAKLASAGELDLTCLTPAQAARLAMTSSELVRRALGLPPKPPCQSDMIDYLSRFGLARARALLDQLQRVAVNGGSVGNDGELEDVFARLRDGGGA
jgi:hypothetical protein